MKTTLFSILVALLAIFTVVAHTFAQDDTTLRLPEGAKARLGKGKINEIKYSPDGTRLSVVSSIGIWIYDAQTGEELELIRGHTSGVLSASYSPDGATLASGSKDLTVCLWDMNTGGLLHTLTGHRDWIRDVSLSPDGRTIASGSEDYAVRLWDVNTRDPLHTLTGHRAGVASVSYSPDGNLIATGSKDGTVLVWELNPSPMADVPESDAPEPERRKEDVTGDGIVNIQDLVLVASNLGQSGSTPADINGDGIVNIQDLVLVANALDASASASKQRGGS